MPLPTAPGSVDRLSPITDAQWGALFAYANAVLGPATAYELPAPDLVTDLNSRGIGTMGELGRIRGDAYNMLKAHGRMQDLVVSGPWPLPQYLAELPESYPNAVPLSLGYQPSWLITTDNDNAAHDFPGRTAYMVTDIRLISAEGDSGFGMAAYPTATMVIPQPAPVGGGVVTTYEAQGSVNRTCFVQGYCRLYCGQKTYSVDIDTCGAVSTTWEPFGDPPAEGDPDTRSGLLTLTWDFSGSSTTGDIHLKVTCPQGVYGPQYWMSGGWGCQDFGVVLWCPVSGGGRGSGAVALDGVTVFGFDETGAIIVNSSQAPYPCAAVVVFPINATRWIGPQRPRSVFVGRMWPVKSADYVFWRGVLNPQSLSDATPFAAVAVTDVDRQSILCHPKGTGPVAIPAEDDGLGTPRQPGPWIHSTLLGGWDDFLYVDMISVVRKIKPPDQHKPLLQALTTQHTYSAVTAHLGCWATGPTWTEILTLTIPTNKLWIDHIPTPGEGIHIMDNLHLCWDDPECYILAGAVHNLEVILPRNRSLAYTQYSPLDFTHTLGYDNPSASYYNNTAAILGACAALL